MSTPVTTWKVTIEERTAQEYLGRRFTSRVETVGSDVQTAFARLYARIAEGGSHPTGPPFLIASPPKDGVMDIEVGAPCVPVPEPSEGLHAGRLPGGRFAVLVHRGAYEDMARSYEELLSWIGRHGYRADGPVREVYLNGPAEAMSPADYLTELVVLIA